MHDYKYWLPAGTLATYAERVTSSVKDRLDQLEQTGHGLCLQLFLL